MSSESNSHASVSHSPCVRLPCRAAQHAPQSPLWNKAALDLPRAPICYHGCAHFQSQRPGAWDFSPDNYGETTRVSTSAARMQSSAPMRALRVIEQDRNTLETNWCADIWGSKGFYVHKYNRNDLTDEEEWSWNLNFILYHSYYWILTFWGSL